jgi:hypothetical protein
MKRAIFPQRFGFSSVAAILVSLAASAASAQPEIENVWYNCLSREVFTPEKQDWCDRWQVLQNGTFIVPENLDPDAEFTTVTLENGEYMQEDGQFGVVLVNERGWQTFGDIDGDGKEDAAVIFGVALDPNGREIGTFLTAVMDIDGEAQALTPTKLGDRILLNAPIHIADNRITVPFLTQTETFDRDFGIDNMAVVSLETAEVEAAAPGIADQETAAPESELEPVESEPIESMSTTSEAIPGLW